MKKSYKTSSKLWMMLLCSLATLVMIISMLGIVFIAEEGAYSSTPLLMDQASQIYALRAIANYHGGEIFGDCDISLEGTGFSYGIIEGSLNGQDVNDRSIYVDRNFSGEVPQDYKLATFYLGENPRFEFSDRLFGLNYCNENANYERVNYAVEGIGYDVIDKVVYVYANGAFYPVCDEDAYEVDPNLHDSYGDEAINRSYEQIWKNHEPKSEKNGSDTNADKLLYMGDRGFPSMEQSGWSNMLFVSSWEDQGALYPKNVADISSMHDALQAMDYPAVDLKRAATAAVDVPYEGNRSYTVVFFRSPTVDMTGGYLQGNLYAQATILGEAFPVLAIVLPIVLLISFAVALWMLILLLCAAGHRYGNDGITTGLLSRIPMDLLLVIVGVIETCLFGAVYAVICHSFGTAYATIGFIASALFIIAASMIALGWLMSVACNIKMGRWWKNTLIYHLLHAFFGWCAKRGEDARKITQNIRWSTRIWIVFFAFVWLEFFGLLIFNTEPGLWLAWFAEKILFFAALFIYLKHYAVIKAALLQMADGDLTVKVDTKKMPPDLYEQGEAINIIGDGLNTAVMDRMKSERMKTELITNVSHDIKTPLTSIINYVDLLEKEQIENDKAGEYLQVLDRQSKRLKKLIEDLIEASKAATGNIKFQMESVNARMILNQSIGEFEDRLEKNTITLVGNIPEEDIYIWADNRYLWRVFDNLMSNIVKYAQPGTRAYVDMVAKDGTVTFTFRNTSKNELNITAGELMERFVRGDASRNTEGNGLGLSIARSLTESMDGTMDLAIDGDLFKVILTFRTR